MFLLRWIPAFVSSVCMYLLFYFWHGSVLNDFIRMEVNMSVFFTLTAITYFIFGLFIAFLHGLTFFRYHLPTWARIISVGFIVGMTGYAISIVLPVSVNRTLYPVHILLDMGWQVTEQVAGSLVYYFLYRLVGILGYQDVR